MIGDRQKIKNKNKSRERQKKIIAFFYREI